MGKSAPRSGARLSLPLKLRFSDEVVDLGVPGEDTINGGARYAKRLFCEGGSFVSAQGAQTVAWVANKRFEISKFKFKFPRARTYEIIGLVLGCIETKFCK